MINNPDTQQLMRKLAGHRHLLDGILNAPREKPYVTMWRPDRDPELETVTFGQFLELASRFAGFYVENHLSPGETVVLIMPQGIELMAAFAGALLAGVIPTILAYPTFKIDPEKYRFGLVGVTRIIRSRLVVLDRDFPSSLLEHVRETDDTRVVQIDARSLSEKVTELASSAPSPDDVAFIQHSAGTTGLQKGVALPHRSVLNQLRHLAGAMNLSEQDRIVSWLPLYHDMGLIACFVLPLTCHMQVVMESPTDWVLRPGSLLRLATEHRSTLCWLPNFAFQFMARRVPEEEKRSFDLSSLRALINCSEPVSAFSMREFHRAFQAAGVSERVFHSSYAMAENTFAVTQSCVDGVTPARSIQVDPGAYLGGRVVPVAAEAASGGLSFVSSGRCLEDNAVRICDDDGVDLVEGRPGEIFIRSDSLFQGYYGRPGLTEKAFKDGWYRTGDVGFTVDGELYVTGRKDDLIIVGGKNLYPQDIEAIACSHPSIHDGRAVAFGIFNPALGTQDLFVVAEVNAPGDLRQRQSIEAEIRRSVLGEIGVTPRVVRAVSPMWLVKSTAGKPARSTTRAKFLRENPEFNLSNESENGKQRDPGPEAD